MKSTCRNVFLIALICTLMFLCCACKDDGEDEKGSFNSDTNSSPPDDTGTTSTDGDDTDTGSEESGTGSEEPGTDEDAVSTPEEITVESIETVGAMMTMVSYTDATVPTESNSARQLRLDEDWNKIVPKLCDALGNHVSCPSIECDEETKTATLMFESSFDGCELNGCYFMNKSVSGEMSIHRGDDKTTIGFNSFQIGTTSFDGGLEIVRGETQKTITFTDSSGDDECDGLMISLEEKAKATCISGEVTLTLGDDDATSDVVEKRKLDLSDVIISAKGYDIGIDGTVTWAEDVACIGPQSGSITLSIQSKAKDDEDNPLLAIEFPITFDIENKSRIREVIEGSEKFKSHENYLPRDVFCSLPGIDIDDVTLTHGDADDFKNAEFVKNLIMKIVEQFVNKMVESPKVTALKAVAEGLSAEDVFTKIMSIDGKVLRFLKAPVKGLCSASPGTCPEVTVTCGDAPGEFDTESPPVHDCQDTDMGYDIGGNADQAPESIELDFTGGNEGGSCETANGKKYGGKIKIERDLLDPIHVTLTLSDFAIYRTEDDTEIANTFNGQVYAEISLESDPCVKDEQLTGSITLATPEFTEEGDKGLSFQKGTCPETIVVFDPLTIRLEDKTTDPDNERDRATEQFYMTWQQNEENYYLSTFYDSIPQLCKDDPDMPDWSGENDDDAVYYDLPMSCTCPYQGPVTIGTHAYAIVINNEECIELCIAIAGAVPKADELCETAVCDVIIPEDNGTIELASADMSMTLGFSGMCGEVHTCEYASLNEEEPPDCLNANDKDSSTPCTTMLSTKKEHRADCFKACVQSTSVDTGDWIEKVLSAQFSSIDELFETVCVTLD